MSEVTGYAAKRPQTSEILKLAREGSPRALREVFESTVSYLAGSSEVPICFLVFFADCLAYLVEKKSLWERAEKEFVKLDRSTYNKAEILLGNGPRVLDPAQRRIGRSFNKAFCLDNRHGRFSGDAIAPNSESDGSLAAPFKTPEYFNIPVHQTYLGAKEGSPADVRQLLAQADHALRVGEIGPDIRRFVSFGLELILGDSDLWESAEENYNSLDCSGNSRAGSHPGIASKYQARFARLFTRAFRIAKKPGKLKHGESPKHIGLSSPTIDRTKFLMEVGVSRRDSIDIVHAAYPSLSKRHIDEWMRFQEIGAPEPDDLCRRQCWLAAAVLQELPRRKNFESACFEVAQIVACRYFPNIPAKLDGWAYSVVDDSQSEAEGDPTVIRFARGLLHASETGRERPRTSKYLDAMIFDEVDTMIWREVEKQAPNTTVLPPEAVTLLSITVSKAYGRAAEVRKTHPRWQEAWAYLERRYARAAETESSSSESPRPLTLCGVPL